MMDDDEKSVGRQVGAEVEYLLNRSYITYNRKGHRAFAVFLLLFFIGIALGLFLAFIAACHLSLLDFLHFKKEKKQTEIKEYIEEQNIIDEDALGIAVDQRL